MIVDETMQTFLLMRSVSATEQQLLQQELNEFMELQTETDAMRLKVADLAFLRSKVAGHSRRRRASASTTGGDRSER